MMKKICQIILAAGLLLSLQTGSVQAAFSMSDGFVPEHPACLRSAT